jgi:hypothetical protein
MGFAMGIELTAGESSLSSRLSAVLDFVTYHNASNAKDKDAIYALRYEAYLAEGAIDPNPEKRFHDAYDDMDNCWIFGVHLDGELVSAIRFHVISKQSRKGPALDVFPELVSPLIESGMTIVDPTRLVVSRDASRRHPELAYLTVRVACMAAEYFNAVKCLATVRVEHEAFYRRIFDFVPACAPRPYPTLKRPIALMFGDMDHIRDRVAKRYPVFTSSEAERADLFERPGSHALIAKYPDVEQFRAIAGAPLMPITALSDRLSATVD